MYGELQSCTICASDRIGFLANSSVSINAVCVRVLVLGGKQGGTLGDEFHALTCRQKQKGRSLWGQLKVNEENVNPLGHSPLGYAQPL